MNFSTYACMAVRTGRAYVSQSSMEAFVQACYIFMCVAVIGYVVSRTTSYFVRGQAITKTNRVERTKRITL
jgi:hypothetical protein